MKSFMKHYKFESSIIFFELLFQNLLLLGSTLITMYMAKLVMEGDLRGILICSAGIMILYLILELRCSSHESNRKNQSSHAGESESSDVK